MIALTQRYTQHASMYIGDATAQRIPRATQPTLLHVLDRQGSIVATLENKSGYEAAYWDDEHTEVLNTGQNTYEFKTVGGDRNPANRYLDIENGLVIRDLDGYFRPFVIKEVDDLKDDKRTKRVFAESTHYELNHLKIVEPTTLQGATLQTAAEYVLSGTGWELGEVDYVGIRTITFSEPMNPLQALHHIRSTFEIELRFRVGRNGNRFVEKRVDLIERIGVESRKEIIFGKDAKSIRRLVDSSGVYTVAYGWGPQDEKGEHLTFASVNNGEPYIMDTDAMRLWGERWYVYQPETEDGEMTPERLLSLTQTDLNKRIAAAVQYEVDAITLERVYGYEHEKVRIGDTVRIKDEHFSPALYLEARVIEVRRSYVAKDRDVFVLGNYREIHPEIDRRVSDLERYLNRVGGSFESRRGAQNKADQAYYGAIEYAEQKVAEAEIEIEDAKQRIQDAEDDIAQAQTDLSNLGNIVTNLDMEELSDGIFVSSGGDMLLHGKIIAQSGASFDGPVIARGMTLTGNMHASNATLTGNITASTATFLEGTFEETTIKNANIQNATITGHLDTVSMTTPLISGVNSQIYFGSRNENTMDGRIDYFEDSMRFQVTTTDYLRVSNNGQMEFYNADKYGGSGSNWFFRFETKESLSHSFVQGGRAGIKFLNSGTDNVVQIRDNADNAYRGIRASGFEQSSSQKFKRGIRPFTKSALDIVKRNKIYEFEYYNFSEQQIGMIYERSTKEIKSGDEAVSLNKQVGVLWKAVQELTERVDQIGS